MKFKNGDLVTFSHQVNHFYGQVFLDQGKYLSIMWGDGSSGYYFGDDKDYDFMELHSDIFRIED